MWGGLVQTEKRKNEHDDDDQADEINDSIHDCLRTSKYRREQIYTHRSNICAVSKFPRHNIAQSETTQNGLRDRLRGNR
jgi:hypothetical protein